MTGVAIRWAEQGAIVWRVPYWRIVAIVLSRPYPYVIAGHTLLYCWRCCGWGQSAGGDECSTCRGQGFDRIPG
jgi:hypothetical protein